MRRLFATLSALTFLGGLIGCQHTCGVCDCDPCNWGCCCTCAGMGYRSASGASFAPTPAPAATVPPAVEMAPPAAKVGEPIKEPAKSKEADKEPEKSKEPAKEKAPDKDK